tara:strand:- start:88 stop:1995 length:1908 start_codon:yes stop_codon:yes gene_type:complete
MNNLSIFLKKLSRKSKTAVLILNDFLIAFLCWAVFGPPLSILIASNFEGNFIGLVAANYLSFLVPYFLALVYFNISGFYRPLVKFFDSRDSIFRCLIGSLIFGLSWGALYLIQYKILVGFMATILLQSILLSCVFYAFLQISRDIARIILYPVTIMANSKPIIIYGAGSAGNELYQTLKVNKAINVVGFFDNSPELKGLEINNIKIYGKNKHLEKLVISYPGLEVYLAIPSLSLSERREIITDLEGYKVAVRSIPALHEVVADQRKMAEIQDLSMDDVLPRTRVAKSDISFVGEVILITGAGGSIGSEIVRQVLSGRPAKLILYELSEINLYSIQSEAEAIKKAQNISCELIGVLGDVKDKSRLSYILNNHKVDNIYHAAAYKHVPIVEYFENISEGIKNNIFGTKAVCEAAILANVKKVVVISTDKAVRPTNIMGASKRFAEMIVQSMDNRSSKTKFCMVRFGNVANSSGSVIPLFRKQISEGGPVTITHKEVTRFFMTIAEASSLVIQAGQFAKGGEVFILDMGEQVKISDLAERLIHLSGRSIQQNDSSEGIEIREVGLRPGEKLYEELLISGKEEKTPNSKIFKSMESYPEEGALYEAFDRLSEHVSTNNVTKIRDILKDYVEGFREGTTK